MKRDQARLRASSKPVQAFREATGALASPRLELFTSLLTMEDSPLVRLALPLVNFSPLNALPLELPATQAAHAPEPHDNSARRDTALSIDTVHPRGRTGATEPRTPNRLSDFSSNALPRTASHATNRVAPDTHVDRPAVAHNQTFSLKPRHASTGDERPRRASAPLNEFHENPAREKGGLRSQRKAATDERAGSSPHAAGGSQFEAFSAVAKNNEREALAKNNERAALNNERAALNNERAASSETDSPALHKGVNLHPARNEAAADVPVLDGLVDSALQAIAGRRAARAINNHDLLDAVRRSLLATLHQSQSETNALSTTDASSSPVHNAPKFDARTNAGATTGAAKPPAAVKAETAINLIDSLADSVLRNGQPSNAGQPQAGAKNAAGETIAARDALSNFVAASASESVPSSAASFVSSSSESVAASAMTTGHAATLPAQQPALSQSSEASFTQHQQAAGETVKGETGMEDAASVAASLSQQRINAQRLASIVNDVLAEQARLHGVDLS